MVTGRVLRRHAGGYLVFSDELNASLQCPLRARLKKEGVSVFTGDLVELDEVEFSDSSERGSAVIAARLERRNLLTKPYIANVDQVFILQAIHQPEWNSLLCDRYLVHLQLELPAVRPFVCVNKCDLATDEEISALRNIYESIDYRVFFVSAKENRGIQELSAFIAGHTSVLTGPSGVGKSSILNALNPALNLKVDVNEELLVGRHTTTYSELYKMDTENGPGWVCDTPGFSLGELRHPEPAEVAWQFPELAHFAGDCKYGDCLHLVEQGCNVLANLEKIPAARYESYCVIVSEAQQEQQFRKQTSQKVETGTVKVVGGGKTGKSKLVPKLNNRQRAISRRKEKQQLNDEDRVENDELWLNDDMDDELTEGQTHE
jgi:ribosome biogenesis GTPase / thiamine phosphate phosphatase